MLTHECGMACPGPAIAAADTCISKPYLFSTAAWIIGPPSSPGRPIGSAPRLRKGAFDAEAHLSVSSPPAARWDTAIRRSRSKQRCKGRVDAIICDGGSMDAGPYYLGTGTEYFEREAVKADFRHMVEAGKKIGCPVILGSSGMAGGNRNLDWMIDVAKEVFAELERARTPRSRSSAPSSIRRSSSRNSARARCARPASVPSSSEEALRESTIVGQMGIHPLITALESGAQYILAGRSCDIALFASDMIRRGIDAGLAYHVGHVLECGALACDPGSPSDCLVAEIYDDGSALFIAPNSGAPLHGLFDRRPLALRGEPSAAAVLSRGHPGDGEDAVLLPGQPDAPASATAASCAPASRGRGASSSRDRRRLGARKVSLIYIDPADLPKIPPDVLVYGRNGVQATPVDASQRELGIIIETAGKDAGGRRAAGEPADALSHPLRLSRPQGDRRQHRLSAVAQPRQLQARGRAVRRDRAERHARSGVLRELCARSRRP